MGKLSVLLIGRSKDILEVLNRYKINYHYDAGDYYISEFDYNRFKNYFAYNGVI